LYFQAQAFDYVGHGNALTPGKYVWDAVAADALSDYQLLNPSQRAVWETAMAAYVTLGYTRKDLLDDSMAAIDAALMNVPVDALPVPSSGLNAHLVEALTSAAPTYRATLWGVDDREIVFHEASHTIVTPGYGAIGAGIENASTALHVAEPEGLWHAVIFYTAGRVVADAVALSGVRYEMVADSVDVYTGPWKNYCAALVEHWQPYLDGHTGSIDDALTSVVATVTS
jgi:hypothetical protein